MIKSGMRCRTRQHDAVCLFTRNIQKFLLEYVARTRDLYAVETDIVNLDRDVWHIIILTVYIRIPGFASLRLGGSLRESQPVCWGTKLSVITFCLQTPHIPLVLLAFVGIRAPVPPRSGVFW